jgi:hypothetical protein
MMALRNKSLFLYGFEITTNNRSLDFQSVFGGPTILATLNLGYYSLTSLVFEIGRAMNAADPFNTYGLSVNRTADSGLGNRVTISSAGVYLKLLFGTGPRTTSSVATLIGFNASDYSGATHYQGNSSAGIILIPEYVGYSYLGPDFMRTVFGSLNISARGDKEAIVWQVQKFFQMEFRFESEAKVISEWTLFMTWAIQQKMLEFTPDVTLPNNFYQCTLESTDADGKGLGYRMTEMLPDFPFNYRTGMMKFRQKVS